MGKGAKGKRGVKRSDKKPNPLFEKRPRNFRFGNDVQPKRNMTRFVRWPKYIQFQRQKRILLSRIKVPGAIAQFSRALEKNQAKVLYKLLKKYSPEDAKEKRTRLTSEAKAKAEKQQINKQKPYALKFGLNHVTKLIEDKRAKFVAIAADVDPIELVLWMPALCRRMNVPYAFVRGTSELGQLVHQKNASCVALTDVRKEDEAEVNNLATAFRSNFNDNTDMRKKDGGFVLGHKSQIKFSRNETEKEKETIKRAQGK